MSQLLDQLRKLSPQELSEVADFLAPLIVGRSIGIPKIFNPGGHNRLVFRGENVAIWDACINLSSGNVIIGEKVFFGHGVSLLTGTHDVNKTLDERMKFPREGRDIVLDEGVWIASGATILGPCHIGAHAVVCAGAVMTPGDYPGGCVYGGVPARMIKKLELDA